MAARTATKGTAAFLIKLLGGIAIVVLLFVFPHIFTKPFPQHIMILILMYVVLGQAWNVLGGYSGQLSLGNQIFLTLGAYTSTMLLVKLGVSPWLGMLPGIVISSLAALAIGTLCFNLKGHYFAIATIGLSEIVFIIFLNWDFINSSYGFQIRFVSNSLLWMTWAHKLPYYYFILILALLVVTFVWKMDRSTLGIYLRAIKEDELRVKSLGIDTRKYKLLAFVISAVITTITGTFYAQYVMYIDPDSLLNLDFALLIIILPLVGGMGTVLGPILGACLLVPLAEYLRTLLGGGGRGVHLILYGLIIMVIALFQPRGLIGIIQAAQRRGVRQRMLAAAEVEEGSEHEAT